MFMLKHRDFYHQSIKYSFNWNVNHHREKINQLNANRQEFIRLGKYFKEICEGTLPNNLFNTKEFPRVSQFKIRGVKNAYINSFSKKLIREGKIQNLDSNSKLPNQTQKVFSSFKENEINKIPGHEAVLKNILIKDEDSIAIEVPIWKKVKASYITGHVDLIQIENDIVKIIDYKPEDDFMFSMPQVATYGLLIKSIFNFDKIICVTFNKKHAWEYDPNILLTDVKKYLLSQRIETRSWENFIEF